MSKQSILGELWLKYKPNYPRLTAGDIHSNDKFWAEYFQYNDLGLPLAYAAEENLITLNDRAKEYLNETWTLLCKVLAVDPDENYDDLESLFLASPIVRIE